MAETNIQAPEQQSRISMDNAHAPDAFYEDTDDDSLVNTELTEDPHCKLCQEARFIAFEGKSGTVEASSCSCLNQMSKTGAGWEKYKAAQKKAELVTNAEIPNRYFKVTTCTNRNQELDQWFDDLITGKNPNRSLFFYGGVGTGKTHSSLYLGMKYLQKTENKTCLYIPTYNLLEFKRKCYSYSYEEKHLKSEAEFEFNEYRNRVKNADFLVLDELGQEPLSGVEKRLIFDIIDHRYSANKITILISNHCDNKSQSLGGQMLSKLVGERISSRLKSAKSIYFTGADRRLQENLETITEDDIERFMVPAKILTHGNDEHQIMTWLTRNPAFETVSTKDRCALTTENSKGELVDKDRLEPSSYEDVWVQGDYLTITGPVCDHEDKKLYALLLKELASGHREGRKGLDLYISINNILRLSNLFESGENVTRIKRQLNRLVRMSLNFRNVNGNKWMGPLINDVEMIGDGQLTKLKIRFNEFMISFYRYHLYTTFNKPTSQSLKGDSSALYLFYVSHFGSKDYYPVTLEKCKKLLGIPKETPRKAVLRRVNGAIKELIQRDVLDPSGTFFEKNSLYARRGSAMAI